MAYAHGKNTTITINSSTHPFLNASITQTSNNAETTNYLTSGNYDSIDGIHSVTVSGDIVFDPTTTVMGSGSTFVEGAVQTPTIAVSDGTNTKTLGVTVRWESIDWKLDVQDKAIATVTGKGKITSRWA